MIHLNGLPRCLGVKKNRMLAAAMLAIVGLNAAAVADPDAPVTRDKKVSLANIDLSTMDGQRVARERLRQTARNLCAQLADELDLSRHTNYLACVDTAMTNAEPRLQAMARLGGADLLAHISAN